MANPATPADVVKRWRSLSDQETINAQTFLDDAWRAVRRAVPDIETRLAAAGSEDLTADTVKVLADAALRVLKNPDGNRRESVDDFTWERDAAVAAGLLYVTTDELDLLRPAPVGYIGPAYVISLGG